MMFEKKYRQFNLFALLMMGLLVFGCMEQKAKSDKLAVTFFPIAEIAKNILKDKQDIILAIPPSAEPHDYELTPKEQVEIEQSQANIVLGIGFDSIENKFPKKNQINSSKNILFIKKSNQTDPHIWLSIKNMIIMTQNINEELEKIDPDSKEFYNKNSEEYINKLKKLDLEYSIVLSNCSDRKIFVSHNAFSYLAKDYNFEVFSISGLSEESEPTATELAALIDQIKKEKIKYILYEEMGDSKIAQTIAKETSAKLLSINPAEGTKNKTYIEIMEDNLIVLKEALNCG